MEEYLLLERAARSMQDAPTVADRKAWDDLVGLARDPPDAAITVAAGIEIRRGDYFDMNRCARLRRHRASLLVSTHAFTDRMAQHYNVITAARTAGVKHVVYNPIIRKAGSGFPA